MPAIDDLIATTARLRGPEGCPWDKVQTHRTLCDCLVEEVAEVLQAIDADDTANLREELGDLLFHIVLHAQMATEAGNFTFEDLAREVTEKMIRRHPHVFGDAHKLSDPEAVIKQWEQIKLKEKGVAPVTRLKPQPASLNALLLARETWKQIAKQGLPVGELVDAQRIRENALNLDEATAGQRLFELVATCREAGIDPDSALRRHTTQVRTAVEVAQP